jgi:hypothetical protein
MQALRIKRDAFLLPLANCFPMSGILTFFT